MNSRKMLRQFFTVARSKASRYYFTTTHLSKISRLSDEDETPQKIEKRVGIVGVPTAFGQRKKGTELGPKVIREASLKSKMELLGIDVRDYGDVEIEEVDADDSYFKLLRPKTHASNSLKISEAVARVVEDGRVCITLGGDHGLGLGSVHGHAAVRPNLCVIWIDAHADLNTPLTSMSGNFHGMPTSFLIHEAQEFVPAMPEFAEMRSCIGADDIVYIGLRQIDPAEKLMLEECRIRHYSMHDVDQKGIVAVLRETLDHLRPGPARPIHLSVDIDALDPLLAQSTGTPVSGGLTLRELLYIAEEVHETGCLSAVDLVEVNPLLEPHRLPETVASALAILLKSMGDKRGGLLPDSYSLERPEDFGLVSRADEYVEYDED